MGYLVGIFISLATLALWLPPVFAGGGLVSITSDQTEPLNVGEIYTVTAKAQKTDNTSCVNCPIYFKFVEGLPGDFINMLEPATNNLGKASAQVSSKTAGNKVIYAVLTLPDGQIYESSSYILNFMPVQAPQIAPVPYPTIIPITQTPVLTIGKSIPIDGLKNDARQVVISWSPIAGADFYDVKLRPADYSNWAIPINSPTQLSYIKLILSSNVDYYVQIEACNNSACMASKETLVAKTQDEIVEAKPLLGDQKLEELQAKVDNLEQQVVATQKKQGFLEKQITRIFSFLKSVFPFFK